MDYWRKQLETPWGSQAPRRRAGDEEETEDSSDSSGSPGSWGSSGNGSGPAPTPPTSPAPPNPPWRQAHGQPPSVPTQPPAWQQSQPSSQQPPPPPWQARTQQQPAYQQGPSWQYGGSSRDDAADERAARLTAILLGVGVAALVIGLVVFFTVRTLRTEGNPGVATSPPLTTPEDAARVVGGLGPPQGADVVTYAAARKQALAEATGNRVAVVSLNAYVSEAKAKAVVGQAEVVGLLAAAPGGAPALVTGSMQSWVTSQTAEARAERDEIQRLIPTAGNDPAFQRFYREEVVRLDKLLNAIKPDGNLVFGVVVRGAAADLQALGGNGDVRLVDVGPDGATESSNYRGLRPEETSRANEPNTRPPA